MFSFTWTLIQNLKKQFIIIYDKDEQLILIFKKLKKQLNRKCLTETINQLSKSLDFKFLSVN